ncbi:MAG: DUF523 domain-containing protein [Chloroflexota bacterium]|nr:MAG: DUF523 domain-containing protein [Chloroflexota bacterium]
MPEEKEPPIIVSACLAGLRTNYLGEAWPYPKIIEMVRKGKAIPICPEQLGGLSTPRIPAERRGDQVIDKNGMDRTEQFNRGAELVSQLVELTGAKVAVLKADSPSCGVGRTYDGTFSDTLIAGDGVTAERLRKLGMELFTEENF